MQITTIIILNCFNGNKVSVRFITIVLETTYTNIIRLKSSYVCSNALIPRTSGTNWKKSFCVRYYP